jgi:sulfur-carrier protein
VPKLTIPVLLRPLVDGQKELTLPGSTVREVLTALVERYPAVKERIFDDEGRIDLSLAIAIDGEVETHPLSYPVKENAEMSIIPAIGGGAA